MRKSQQRSVLVVAIDPLLVSLQETHNVNNATHSSLLLKNIEEATVLRTDTNNQEGMRDRGAQKVVMSSLLKNIGKCDNTRDHTENKLLAKGSVVPPKEVASVGAPDEPEVRTCSGCRCVMNCRVRCYPRGRRYIVSAAASRRPDAFQATALTATGSCRSCSGSNLPATCSPLPENVRACVCL